MKIAITGASGHLGSEIINALGEETGKEKIVGITRTPDKAKHWGIEIRQGDYNNADDWDEALTGIDIVLMVSGMDEPDKRIGQHRNVINAAKKNGVRKFLYTSFFGKQGNTAVDPLLKSYRQTEKDIKESGMEWAIGRDGLYIEPDVEYVEEYIKAGEIANCAGYGLASYTTRKELAYAYSQMILRDDRNGKIFNLGGAPLSQQQLTDFFNKTFNTHLIYRPMSPREYLEFQKEVNGEFLGSIVAGIYTKIRNGEFVMDSDYETAAGRKHISWEEYFEQLD